MRSFFEEYGFLIAFAFCAIILMSIAVFLIPDMKGAENFNEQSERIAVKETNKEEMPKENDLTSSTPKTTNIFVGENGLDKILAVVMFVAVLGFIGGILRKTIPIVAAFFAWYIRDDERRSKHVRY